MIGRREDFINFGTWRMCHDKKKQKIDFYLVQQCQSDLLEAFSFSEIRYTLFLMSPVRANCEQAGFPRGEGGTNMYTILSVAQQGT